MYEYQRFFSENLLINQEKIVSLWMGADGGLPHLLFII